MCPSEGKGPDAIAPATIADAIATYERSLLSADSSFDRYQYGGDSNALSPSAVRGLALFRGRARCASCREIDNTSALFTDNEFHLAPTGLPANVALTAPYMHDGSIETLALAVELELYGRDDAARYPIILTLAERA